MIFKVFDVKAVCLLNNELKELTSAPENTFNFDVMTETTIDVRAFSPEEFNGFSFKIETPEVKTEEIFYSDDFGDEWIVDVIERGKIITVSAELLSDNVVKPVGDYSVCKIKFVVEGDLFRIYLVKA